MSADSKNVRKGTLKGGIPYTVTGSGPPVVVINGLPAAGKESRLVEKGELRFLAPLTRRFTAYSTKPAPGMSSATTMADIAAVFAEAIDAELGQPVPVTGISTGGAIALQLAVDHPGVVSRMALGSTAHRIGPEAVEVYKKCIALAEDRRGPAAMASLAPIVTRSRLGAMGFALASKLGASMAGVKNGTDLTDMAAALRSEMEMDIADRLGQVTAPTLIVTGELDRCYPLDVVRATVAGIPGATLIVQEGKAHTLSIKRFWADALAFLSST
jgi:pimeloyl-ACP methyl ester carboxylesterase